MNWRRIEDGLPREKCMILYYRTLLVDRNKLKRLIDTAIWYPDENKIVTGNGCQITPDKITLWIQIPNLPSDILEDSIADSFDKEQKKETPQMDEHYQNTRSTIMTAHQEE